jgi:probable O-glycosylation ligase (exosortase A-associated)
MRDAAFAFCWLLLIPLSLSSAYIGVLVWMWVAIFSPNDLMWGFMREVPFNKLIAALTFAALIFRSEKKNFYFDKTGVWLLLLAVAGTASALDSAVNNAAGWDLYFKVIKELILAFLIMGTMESRYRIHMAVFALCIAVGYEGFVEGIEYILSGGTHKVLGTPSVGDNNSVAVEILMSVPLLWYLIQYSAVKYMKIVLSIVLVFSVIAVIATFSRGGFVGLLILGIFLIAKSKNKFGGLLLIGATAGLIYLAAPSDYASRVQTIDDAGEDSSFMGRVNAWKVSTAAALANPLDGAGFHGIQQPEVWQRYRPQAETITFPATPPMDANPHAAHSIYFEVLGDLGFTGLAIFAAVILIGLRSIGRIKRMARRHPSQAWAGDLAEMMQISMIIYCVCGAALSLAYWEGFYIFIALISRLQRTVLEATRAEASPQTSPAAKLAIPRPAGRPAIAGIRAKANSGAWR